MMTNVYQTAELGDLVVAVFDEAAHFSSDPREVSRLATRTVTHILQRARKALTPPPPSSARTQVAARHFAKCWLARSPARTF
jgi:hypothetical protein